MKFIASLCSIVFAVIAATPSLADNVLRLNIVAKGGIVSISAPDHARTPPHTLPIESLSRLESIYFSLECFVSSDCANLRASEETDAPDIDPAELVPILKLEGERVFGPFAELIRTADEVSFRIDWSMLKMPLDLLYVDGNPLFLSKKISYTVGSPPASHAKLADSNWVGLLVSDVTADPDRAIFSLQRDFPRSRSFDISDFPLRTIENIDPVDFIAISAHGHVSVRGEDHIAIGDSEKLTASSLLRLRPKLVYLDSCNLGVSTEHIQELQRGGTRYVVAPILSNEAGESSTSTIEWFFSELAKGVSPVAAMSFARSKLYDRYANDDIKTRLWRSFPFRVYQLN